MVIRSSQTKGQIPCPVAFGDDVTKDLYVSLNTEA
jgi:hypothetical protein